MAQGLLFRIKFFSSLHNPVLLRKSQRCDYLAYTYDVNKERWLTLFLLGFMLLSLMGAKYTGAT